jgi:hypothetical protein
MGGIEIGCGMVSTDVISAELKSYVATHSPRIQDWGYN